MSLYTLQKLIRDVNRKPQCREAYFQSPATFANGYDLATDERDALLKLDVGALSAWACTGCCCGPSRSCTRLRLAWIGRWCR
jgi:hypothetical protein